MKKKQHGPSHGHYRARGGLGPGSSVTAATGSCIHEASWSPYERKPTRDSVIVLVDEEASFGDAALRAVQLARGSDAEVRLVVATRDAIAGSAGVAKRGALQRRLARLTWHRGLPIELVRGALADAIQAIANNYTPRFVVVGSEAKAEACTIVDKLGVPVVVAQEVRVTGKVIAATALQDDKLPVLTGARAVAPTDGTAITYFHNVLPMHPLVDPILGLHSGVTTTHDELAADCLARLQARAETDRNADVVIGHSHRTADALIQLAREVDADLLVVGYRTRSMWDRVFGDCVTQQVLDRAIRSVAVVPMTVTSTARM